MVEKREILTRGGVYLAKLDPSKGDEIGKIRPVIILNNETLLETNPPLLFICPLSSQSQPAYRQLHVELSARDNLQVTSYALIEHCRSISIRRFHFPRLAQLTSRELFTVLHRLQILLGIKNL